MDKPEPFTPCVHVDGTETRVTEDAPTDPDEQMADIRDVLGRLLTDHTSADPTMDLINAAWQAHPDAPRHR